LTKQVLVAGAGLGGLATALRLATRGYSVTILEQYHQPGGRLNYLERDGFSWDLGPSFFSMSYEFEALFQDCGVKNPLTLQELDPVYTVNFSHLNKPISVYKDLDRLAKEVSDLEPDFQRKATKYLDAAERIFADTEYRVIKKNFSSLGDYLFQLTKVPWQHAPKMFRSMWSELSKNFKSEEVRIIFSLVAFFLGSTPFDTPAVYSLLNYTELRYDGYWNVKGGMYEIVRSIVRLLEQHNVQIHYNTKVVNTLQEDGNITAFVDQHGYQWEADQFVVNADAASFRGQVLEKRAYREEKLDQYHWTLGPFTMYLGVEGKVPNLDHHNYFLGDNFKDYARTIFHTTEAPDNPYYYVSVSSKSNPESAPEGCENLFVLCPVPDLRHKPDWSDQEELTENIIQDLSKRTGFPIKERLLTQEIWNPRDWADRFNLYKGSGLGLAHDMDQIGGFRPNNKDEDFRNLYYTGASTVPGTGLPIVVISSRLTTEKILNDDRVPV
jgi:phytoene desaturase